MQQIFRVDCYIALLYTVLAWMPGHLFKTNKDDMDLEETLAKKEENLEKLIRYKEELCAKLQLANNMLQDQLEVLLCNENKKIGTEEQDMNPRTIYPSRFDGYNDSGPHLAVFTKFRVRSENMKNTRFRQISRENK